jgi:hypothetical protein
LAVIILYSAASSASAKTAFQTVKLDAIRHYRGTVNLLSRERNEILTVRLAEVVRVA